MKKKPNHSKFCEVCGSIERVFFNKEFQKQLCQKHYSQMKKYDKILDRTIFDKNEIRLFDEHAEIILYKNNKEFSKTLIDLDDVEKCSRYKWCLTIQGYIISYIGKRVLLHRFIMNCDDEKLQIDHINRKRNDNRKSNLRITDNQHNSYNSTVSKRNTTGVKGVTWNKGRKKWVAQICCDGKSVHLGIFKNIDDAIICRLLAEKEYFGEFSSQIHLLEKYNIDITMVYQQWNLKIAGDKIIGVTYRKDKELWDSCLEVNGKRYRKCFETKDEAIKFRLQNEHDMLGDKSPQIHLFKQYNIEVL